MPAGTYNPPAGYTLDAQQAADRLGVTLRTFNRLVHRDLLVPWRLHPTAKRFFSEKEIDRLRKAPHSR